MQDKIGLKTIEELRGMDFEIPDYQRGYRWTAQNVTDLLDDIYEFEPTGNNFYCLQPLVVRQREENILEEIKKLASEDKLGMAELRNLLKGKWEVIDGQQRLTTILILLSCLQEGQGGEMDCQRPMPYKIAYATREKSAKFLEDLWNGKIVDTQANKDFYHMALARDAIIKWLNADDESSGESRRAKLKRNLGHVKFIWYEPGEGEAIDIFIRLNIGRIPLTNAELVRALFLNSGNFRNQDSAALRLYQQEIGQQWDKIENTLGNPEFWSFISPLKYDEWEAPTRIDFILDMVMDLDMLNIAPLDDLGGDRYASFRFFWKFYEKCGKDRNKFVEAWRHIKNIFLMFDEWFNDLLLYHYVGYLASPDSGGDKPRIMATLIDKWLDSCSDKAAFLDSIKKMITGSLASCRDLDQLYESEGRPLPVCRRLLLLHNLQTVINQGNTAIRKYGRKTFYKFPFHVYREENWDIEHIEPRTEDELEDARSQRQYLMYWAPFIADIYLRQRIINFIKAGNNEDSEEFREILGALPKSADRLGEEHKDQIMNFALLDSSTNRSYKNAPFPAKRRTIIDKDRGMRTDFVLADGSGKGRGENDSEANIEITMTPADTSFIPPCTKQVFLKYYNPLMAAGDAWTLADARAYKRDILATLSEFGVTGS